MGFLGVDHVQLAAPPGCEREARRFYGGVLGLQEISKPPPLQARGGVWFRVGAQQLHIGVEASFAPARKAHPALAVSSRQLKTLARRLEEAGAEVSWEELEGRRRFYTSDPWGNRLELIQPLPSTTSWRKTPRVLSEGLCALLCAAVRRPRHR